MTEKEIIKFQALVCHEISNLLNLNKDEKVKILNIMILNDNFIHSTVKPLISRIENIHMAEVYMMSIRNNFLSKIRNSIITNEYLDNEEKIITTNEDLLHRNVIRIYLHEINNYHDRKMSTIISFAC